MQCAWRQDRPSPACTNSKDWKTLQYPLVFRSQTLPLATGLTVKHASQPATSSCLLITITIIIMIMSLIYSFIHYFSKLEHIAHYNAKNQNTVKTNFHSHEFVSVHCGLLYWQLLLSWCLMSSDVIWHIRDKLWPMPKHGSIRKVYACLAVTCHLHFWQNDRDFLRATVVTRGRNGYRNKSQHRKSTLEKKILPPFQQGFEPATFQSRVRRSNHWAIPAPFTGRTRKAHIYIYIYIYVNQSWSHASCFDWITINTSADPADMITCRWSENLWSECLWTKSTLIISFKANAAESISFQGAMCTELADSELLLLLYMHMYHLVVFCLYSHMSIYAHTHSLSLHHHLRQHDRATLPPPPPSSWSVSDICVGFSQVTVVFVSKVFDGKKIASAALALILKTIALKGLR